MPDPLTTVALIVMTLLSLAASALAIGRLTRASRLDPRGAVQFWLLTLCTAGSTATFLYRELFVHQRWQPLEAHVDGLLLIAALFGLVVLFLSMPSRLPGITAFAMPLLTVILAWAICASSFTLRQFQLDTVGVSSLWRSVHLTSVYLGTLCVAVAAIAGGMFLYGQRRLRSKRVPTAGEEGFASLESIERAIVRTSALGFALLTLGLVTGLVMVTAEKSQLNPGWWHSPKIVLATAAWLVYALLMNVRHTTNFRGARAAWLSIFGIVLLLATFGVVTAMPAMRRPAPPSSAQIHGNDPYERGGVKQEAP